MPADEITPEAQEFIARLVAKAQEADRAGICAVARRLKRHANVSTDVVYQACMDELPALRQLGVAAA